MRPLGLAACGLGGDVLRLRPPHRTCASSPPSNPARPPLPSPPRPSTGPSIVGGVYSAACVGLRAQNFTAQNLDLFSFNLTQAEIQTLNGLNVSRPQEHTVRH